MNTSSQKTGCDKNTQIVMQRVALIDKKRAEIQKEIKYPDTPSEARTFFRALLKKGE